MAVAAYMAVKPMYVCGISGVSSSSGTDRAWRGVGRLGVVMIGVMCSHQDADPALGTTDEGAAMMRIVASMCPQCNILFHTAIPSTSR